MIIFTDLDGTLLNQDDYSYEAAIPMVRKLQEQQIPVIPVTSKTRCEVEVLLANLALNDPFVVENGSGAFIPLGEGFNPRRGEYTRSLFGCTYEEAREGKIAIGTILGEDLRGFGDLTATEIVELTGLKFHEAQRAKTREFTEPFVTPRNVSAEKLRTCVQTLGFRVVVGDRFSHLIGGNAGKGKAVKWLIEHYKSSTGSAKIVTVGLGNSPNDLEMLETVDYPIIIPGKNGPHPGLSGRGWEVASSPGCQGWALKVANLLDKF